VVSQCTHNTISTAHLLKLEKLLTEIDHWLSLLIACFEGTFDWAVYIDDERHQDIYDYDIGKKDEWKYK